MCIACGSDYSAEEFSSHTAVADERPHLLQNLLSGRKLGLGPSSQVLPVLQQVPCKDRCQLHGTHLADSCTANIWRFSLCWCFALKYAWMHQVTRIQNVCLPRSTHQLQHLQHPHTFTTEGAQPVVTHMRTRRQQSSSTKQPWSAVMFNTVSIARRSGCITRTGSSGAKSNLVPSQHNTIHQYLQSSVG
jgi:hypothetical protein